MTFRTFFFRKSYSFKEMYDRIYAEDFIRTFKGYADYVSEGNEEPELNKLNCYRGLLQACKGDSDRLNREIQSCFSKYGRLGDKLNVKLYVLENFNYTLTDEIRERINDLVQNQVNIKEQDSLSSNLKEDFYLVDVNFSKNYLDFQFKVNQISIEHQDASPIEVVRPTFLELRLYLKTGIIALFNPEGNNGIARNSLSIVHLLFKKYRPTYFEVSIDEAQLIMINLRLKGQISSPKFLSKDELRIEIYGMNPANQENPFVKFVGDSNLKIFELSMKCLIQGHNCTLKLNGDGKVQIETYVTPNVLDSIIVELDWAIFTKQYYVDYSSQIDQFSKEINRGMLSNQRKRKINSIEREYQSLITTNTYRGLKFKELKLVTTVIFNICLKMIEENLIDKIDLENLDDNFEEHLKKYSNIIDFLSKNLIIKKDLSKKDADKKSELIVRQVHKYLSEADGDAVKIIDTFEGWITCLQNLTQEVR
ncbi:hypothetical protein LAV77_25240 [Priestia megaterium]|uniref:hypothetical protein n=1 Tax=Priestia megaterium TaxID=1404 RepID=UPI002B242B87|nr:hypothetical protein [Priestia megaterium]MEB2268119.1 hypothetical protein [Priestia megaterium]